MKYTILDTYWYTPNAPGMTALVQTIFGMRSLVVGFVAIQTFGAKWKCYMGYGTGNDEVLDAQGIAQGGMKVSKEVAVAHFPNLKPERFTY